MVPQALGQGAGGEAEGFGAGLEASLVLLKGVAKDHTLGLAAQILQLGFQGTRGGQGQGQGGAAPFQEGSQHRTSGPGEGVLHHLGQFTDIAGPGSLEEGAFHTPVDHRQGASLATGGKHQQAAEEGDDVLGPLGKGGDVHHQGAQAEPQALRDGRQGVGTAAAVDALSLLIQLAAQGEGLVGGGFIQI